MRVVSQKVQGGLPAVTGSMIGCLFFGGAVLAVFYLILGSVEDLKAIQAVCYGSLFVSMFFGAAVGMNMGVSMAGKRVMPQLTPALLLCAMGLIAAWHRFLDPLPLKPLWALKQYALFGICVGVMALAFLFFWFLLSAVKRRGRAKYQWQ